jgi:hypothetical protein
VLILLTLVGITYLYFFAHNISLTYAVFLIGIYLFAKIIGYILLPYSKFKIFLAHLIHHSKLPVLSGFEIFKTTLVALLFFGFVFIDPAIWIIESVLVVAMRIWGIAFIKGMDT